MKPPLLYDVVGEPTSW